MCNIEKEIDKDHIAFENQGFGGLRWNGIAIFINQALGFFLSIIIARILSPEDFGIFGMVTAILMLGEIFSDFGLGAAIIYEDRDISKYVNTAWILNIAIGTILSLIAFMTSPLIARFYHIDILRKISQILALNFFLRGLTIIPKATIQKELRFRRLAIINMLEGLSRIICTIVLAFYGYGVWSLVLGSILGNILSVITTLWLADWKFRIDFHLQSAKHLVNYGKYLVGGGIAYYVYSNIDKLLIGKFLGAISLGIYNLAMNLVSYPIRLISGTVEGVLFPMLSKTRLDKNDMQTIFITSERFIAIISLPLYVGLAIFSDEIIHALYGNNWKAAIFPFRILTLYALVKCLFTNTGSIIKAIGRTDISFIITSSLIPFMFLSVYLSLKYGINGVSLAVALTYTVYGFGAMIYTAYITGISFLKIIQAMRSSAIAAALIGIIFMMIIVINNRLLNMKPYIVLIIGILAGIGFYLLILRLKSKEDLRLIMVLIGKKLGNSQGI